MNPSDVISTKMLSESNSLKQSKVCKKGNTLSHRMDSDVFANDYCFQLYKTQLNLRRRS